MNVTSDAHRINKHSSYCGKIFICHIIIMRNNMHNLSGKYQDNTKTSQLKRFSEPAVGLKTCTFIKPHTKV